MVSNGDVYGKGYFDVICTSASAALRAVVTLKPIKWITSRLKRAAAMIALATLDHCVRLVIST